MESRALSTKIVERPAFSVAGLAVATSRAGQAADAGPLAARFFAPGFAESVAGRLDPSATYAVHSSHTFTTATSGGPVNVVNVTVNDVGGTPPTPR